MWCRDMDACLEGDHDHFAALQKFEGTNFEVNHSTDSFTASLILWLHFNLIKQTWTFFAL